MRKGDMIRSGWTAIRYHAARWLWVVGLAGLAQAAFPSSVDDLAPLLDLGARAERLVVAPFDFVVAKSEDEMQREADEVAASARPIYEFHTGAFDSVRITARQLFDALDTGAARPALVARAAARAGVTLAPAGSPASEPRQTGRPGAAWTICSALALGVVTSAFRAETAPS
jgi:hypothetical protein